MKQPKLVDRIMAEHVAMPGFPEIIVTRGFAYSWLAAQGWDKSGRGYGSLDYAVFARPETSAPLTPESERDMWLAKVAADYARLPVNFGNRKPLAFHPLAIK